MLNEFRNEVRNIKCLFRGIKHHFYVKKVVSNNKFKKERIAASIIRNTHSIEKGLALSEPREGFGYEKICELYEKINEYRKISSVKDCTIIYMALDAIKSYLNFHNKINYTSEKIENIHRKYEELVEKIEDYDSNSKLGGIVKISGQELRDTIDQFEHLVNSRHSIRDFSDEEVPLEKLKDAIRIAQKCPSACNRQATRVHILSKKYTKVLGGWLSGTGGFDKSVDKFIIITGKISNYELEEQYQYIVSASIFTGYLSLSLQAHRIGACLIQRPVLVSPTWKKVVKELNIPEDEQIVIMIGVGMLKDEYNIPISNRLGVDEIVTVYE